MNTEIFTLCERASDADSKLSLSGSFNNIRANRVPFVLPNCSIVAKIRFAEEDEGNHRVQIQFIDPDGKPMFQLYEQHLTVKVDPHDRSFFLRLIVNLQKTQINSYGEYQINLLIDGKQTGSIALFISSI